MAVSNADELLRAFNQATADKTSIESMNAIYREVIATTWRLKPNSTKSCG